jgi:hypothetical protein
MYQVKAQTARSVLRCSLKLRFYALTGPSMFYKQNDLHYLLNLIDTPVCAISLLSGMQVDLSTKGHVDFSWEVSRSMVACQGALLLVDASQGVQAQSLSVFHAARERGLKIIPVLNKVIFPREVLNHAQCRTLRSTFQRPNLTESKHKCTLFLVSILRMFCIYRRKRGKVLVTCYGPS